MKKGINFSLQLLKNNRKYHADAIKRIEGLLKNSKSLSSYFKKGLNQHKKYYDDLTLAINTLLGTKAKEKSNNITYINPKDFTPVIKKQMKGRINRKSQKIKI